MIQNFYLENDNIHQFLTIIRSVIESMFSIKPGQYSQLYLTTWKNYMFRDGKKWIGNDKDLLRKLGVKSLGASDPRGWSKPKKFFICTVADYKSDMEKDKSAIIFDNFDLLIKRIHLLMIDDPNQKIGKEPKFREICGHGYNYAFNQNDGDTGIGYCAQYRPNGGWNDLDIALCHMYYGK